MLVFVDDSGDPGCKLAEVSSSHFVISLVLFEDTREAEKAAKAIKALRGNLGFPESVEFKFHKSRPQVRKRFLKVAVRFAFRVRSLVIDKSVIRSEEFRFGKQSFYAYAIQMMLARSGDVIADAHIKIDGGGDREFRKQFLSYVRKRLHSGERAAMRSCTLVDSQSDVLIQMADMIAGSVRRSYDTTKEDARSYKAIFAAHIDDEWLFR